MTNDDNNKTNTQSTDENFDPTRRRFLKNTGFAVGGIAGGSLLGGYFTNQLFSGEEESKDKKPESDYTEARMFFTRYEDFVVLEQATERIFPKDDNGPGAIELGVPYFIDKQLAGSWGSNLKDYRQGDFTNDSAEESSLNRGKIFINGLRKMNKESQDRFDTSFDKADEKQQIEILEDFDSGEVDLKAIGSDSFFTLLREATLDGAYSDPLYGGNRNMEGWDMKEFPGAVPSYADMIEDEEFVKMDPVSLTDYQQKS